MKKPSVTELIKLLDKPALLSWANKIGLQGINIEDYRKDALKNGANFHKEIEDYILHKIPFKSKTMEGNFLNFFSNKEVLHCEKEIETQYFTGRIDIMFKCNDMLYICDFKTNQSNIYLDNKLQLAAYKMAINCDKIGVISIPDFKLLDIEISDYFPYQEILKRLSDIYYLKSIL